HFATARLYNTLALGTGSPTTTGGRQENAIGCQSSQQLVPSRHGNGALAIDLDVDITAAHQFGPGDENHSHQHQHDGCEHADGKKNFIVHLLTPSLQLYARERHEAQRHQSNCNEGDAEALKYI